jgi:hypothetical protein
VETQHTVWSAYSRTQKGGGGEVADKHMKVRGWRCMRSLSQLLIAKDGLDRYEGVRRACVGGSSFARY